VSGIKSSISSNPDSWESFLIVYKLRCLYLTIYSHADCLQTVLPVFSSGANQSSFLPSFDRTIPNNPTIRFNLGILASWPSQPHPQIWVKHHSLRSFPPTPGSRLRFAKSICRAMGGGELKWPNLDLPWISIEFRFAIPPIDELIVKGLVSKTLTFGHTRSTRTHDRDVLLYYCFCCTNRQMKRALDVFCCVHRLTVSPSNRNAQSDRYIMRYGA